MMAYISYVHFFCFLFYIYLIAYLLFKGPKSLTTRMCTALFFCLAIWSYSFIHIHNPHTSLPAAKLFLNISALGGISVGGMFLLFTFVFTEMYRRIKVLYVLMLLLVPLVLIILQWVPQFEIMKINETQRFSYGWDTYFEKSILSLVFLCYAYSYAFAGFYLLYRYRTKTSFPVKRRQADIVLSLGIIIVLTSIPLTALSERKQYHLPFIADIVYVIWSVGILYAMTKYKLFSLTPSTAAENLIETMSDSLLLADQEGMIRHVNSASFLLFACNKEELCGQHISNFFRDGKGERERWNEFLQKKPICNLETWCITKNEREVPVLLSSSPMRDNDGMIQGVVCVIRDMTERRRLEKEVVEVEGREQLRIGHDLHDGLGQHLTGVAFGCKALEEKLLSGSEIEVKDISEITGLIRQAAEAVHHISKGLSPVVKQSGGLLFALKQLAETTESVFSTSCTFLAEESICVNNEVVATHMYRIAQEAITNAMKHGNANRIDISLTARDDKIELRITDNGCGIPDASKRKQGMGLRIMHYRARIIGATLDIVRGASGGTVVACIIPQEEVMEITAC